MPILDSANAVPPYEKVKNRVKVFIFMLLPTLWRNFVIFKMLIFGHRNELINVQIEKFLILLTFALKINEECHILP